MGKNRRRVLCLVAVLLASGSVAHTERLPLKSYTTADGLAHDSVRRIVGDSRGFLWFCTDGGLSRFDGSVFTSFGIEQGFPFAPVTDLLETRNGEYWVATAAGLVRFNPNGRPVGRGVSPGRAADGAMFVLLTPDDKSRRARAITRLLETRDGALWVGTEKGIYRLDRSGLRPSLQHVEIGLRDDMPEQAMIADVIEDRRGRLWIATPDGLIRRWADGSTRRYDTQLGIPKWYLTDLFEDRRGDLWGAVRDGGFFRFTADETRAPPALTMRISLPSAWIWQLFETSDHRFWVAGSGGLAEFFPDGDRDSRLRPYGVRNGLSEPGVIGLSEDRAGNLWLAMPYSGAMRLAREGFTTFDRGDGIQSIGDVFEDRDGHVCFKGHVIGDLQTSVFEGARLPLLSPATPSQVLVRLGCFDGQRFEAFTPATLLQWGWVLPGITLQARNGEWWVGSQEGLFHYPRADHFSGIKTMRPLAVYRAKDGLQEIFRLFEDSKGDVWISSISSAVRGLSRWERDSGRLRDLAGSSGLPSLRDDLPQSFAEDSLGQIWIAFNSGLVRYSHGVFTSFTARDGMPPGTVANMHVDRAGRLWLASAQSGLIRVDDPAMPRPAFVSYTTANGLAGNNIRTIVEDRAGFLYIGGGQGLDRFDPATSRVKHYGTADGLPPGVLVAAVRDGQGELWFGMLTGLARMKPVLEKGTAPPAAWISALRVAGVAAPVSALGEREMSLPELAPDRNHLQIDFVALGFGSGEVRFQYRLEGADAEWNAPSRERTVNYASLAPGRYRFLVRAIDADGGMSPAPATISFTVLSPIWQRWWFLTIAALLTAFTIHRLDRHRVARLLEMANVRTRIATDLHDDIGANLTRIALLSEVAKGPSDDGPLASIARIARESVSSMSDIVWAINPKRERMQDLIRRMRQHAEEVLTARAVTLRFDATQVPGTLQLGMDVRRDLLLVFKEAVNNAARHANCSAVRVELRGERSRMTLSIVDDGIGFDTAAASDGHGLDSMRRRAARLSGALEIASGEGGTTLTLTFPA
jgi:signal transduction histidine kinase/ligand-binding sensor domain-containing protein